MIRRYKRPDNKDALSIINASKREMEFTLSLEINERSGATIIKNIYENFRMLGDALLILKGIESESHIESINELLKLNIKTKRPLGVIGNLRMLRHNINYYGYLPKIEEAKEVVGIAKDFFIPLFNEITNRIKNN
jgi:uncharacterized protein (UPF0332 family)